MTEERKREPPLTDEELKTFRHLAKVFNAGKLLGRVARDLVIGLAGFFVAWEVLGERIMALFGWGR